MGRVKSAGRRVPFETVDCDLVTVDAHDIECVDLASRPDRRSRSCFDDDGRAAFDAVARRSVTGEAQVPVAGQEQVNAVRHQCRDGIAPRSGSGPAGGATAWLIERMMTDDHADHTRGNGVELSYEPCDVSLCQSPVLDREG